MKRIFGFISLVLALASPADELLSEDILVEWDPPTYGDTALVFFYNQSSNVSYLLTLDPAGERIPAKRNISPESSENVPSVEILSEFPHSATNASFAILRPTRGSHTVPFFASADFPVFHAEAFPLETSSRIEDSEAPPEVFGDWLLRGTNLVCRIWNGGNRPWLVPVSILHACKCDFTVVVEFRMNNFPLPDGNGTFPGGIPLRFSTPIYGCAGDLLDLRYVLLDAHSGQFVERVIPLDDENVLGEAVHRFKGESDQDFKVTVYCHILEWIEDQENSRLVSKHGKFVLPHVSEVGDSDVLKPIEENVRP